MHTTPDPGRSPDPQTPRRIASIDLLRGAVMIIMAIDHVRVFAGVPAPGPTLGTFFTRWVTHFCAPVFVFLAGTSCYFYGRRHADLSRHLLLRGLWLVVLELTFCRLAWTFNLDFAHYELAGVIWVIGWCMVLMALLVKLPLAAIGAFGLAVMACHNLMDPHLGGLLSSMGQNRFAALWKIAYIAFFAGPIQMGADGPNLIVLYSIVPWIGVMAAGYAFGRILSLDPQKRNIVCHLIGLGGTALFVVLRGFDLYGDPKPWSAFTNPAEGAPAMPSLLAFLNTNKYPASFQFLLMTLGPAIALIPVLETLHGPPARAVALFGRVPFFFYVLHIPLIHVLAILVSKLREGTVNPWLFANHPMGAPPPPSGYTWGLSLLYAVWAAAIAILYVACRWFAEIKARRRDWWLSYL